MHLLEQALTHRSYVYEKNDLHGIDSNERMEFLGDAVLELIVSQYLYHNFPKEREGKLTKIKGLLVSKAVLSEQAKLIKLGKYILMGASSTGICPSIVADAYEAIVCAVYLDGGLESAREFIRKTLLNYSNQLLEKDKHRNYKSILQEYIQSEHKIQPQYKVIEIRGPDHNREYTVEVSVKTVRKGVGKGRSKKIAEQEAAKHALEDMGYWEQQRK